MINILSIRCGLAFAPYLYESIYAFITAGEFAPRVVRQAGSGLIIRADEQMMLRFQQREAVLGPEEAKHYLATIGFRREFYDVERMQDEVVLASVAGDLLLSHPQSDLWLQSIHVSQMLEAFDDTAAAKLRSGAYDLPDWLSISTGAGRLLISDQRNGKWVLLGSDHLEELERRRRSLGKSESSPARINPPTVMLKGLALRLQSALKLVATLEGFAETGEVTAYEEITPIYSLKVGRSAEGVELIDSDRRVGLNSREARKYAGLIRGELERLRVKQVERGSIRTVFADGDQGRWVLQWGDEVLVSNDSLGAIGSPLRLRQEWADGWIKMRPSEEFFLLLNSLTGACVALTEIEQEHMIA